MVKTMLHKRSYIRPNQTLQRQVGLVQSRQVALLSFQPYTHSPQYSSTTTVQHKTEKPQDYTSAERTNYTNREQIEWKTNTKATKQQTTFSAVNSYSVMNTVSMPVSKHFYGIKVVHFKRIELVTLSHCVIFFVPTGTYQGQWVGGMRHGYGVRQSVPYGMAAVIRSPLRTSINSLRSEHSNGTALLAGERAGVGVGVGTGGLVASPAVSRGGFVLTAHSEAELLKGKKNKSLFRRSLLSGLKLRKSESKSSLASQRSKQSSFRSEAGMSTVSSAASDINSTISLGEGESELPAGEEDVDATATETYAGEWKNDKRTGCGVSRRSDGLCYQVGVGGTEVDIEQHKYSTVLSNPCFFKFCFQRARISCIFQCRLEEYFSYWRRYII